MTNTPMKFKYYTLVLGEKKMFGSTTKLKIYTYTEHQQNLMIQYGYGVKKDKDLNRSGSIWVCYQLLYQEQKNQNRKRKMPLR